MKLRWREHEMIFVSILVVAAIIFSLWELYNPSRVYPAIDYANRFKENGLPFVFWKNVLLPQIAAPLLLYVVYLAINLLILPWIKKISFNDVEKLATFNLLKPILAFVVTSFLLSLGVNIISNYARPHLFNYGNYQMAALFGYNDEPMADLFFGFDRAIGLLLLLMVFMGLRELIIWLIEKPGPKREFRVLVVNNLSPLLLVYFLVPVFINPVHADFMDYTAWAIPILLLYFYQAFWFFPFREGRGWLEIAVITRLLLPILAGAVFSAVVFSGSQKLFEGMIYFLFLLFIVTPVGWLLYQQRKDKILQLKGMEAALAKSNTDLQFLRSQINPHFLFNALNTLYGTALRDKSEPTAEGIQRLGDMMRFMLHENNLDLIPMSKEISYLQNYIALQKLRLPESADIDIEDNIGEVKCKGSIAPMILIPFIENAFKHGIRIDVKSWIRIGLVCSGNAISFEVRNSTHLHNEEDTEKDKSGIGLQNVSDRLKLLYPGRHELHINRMDTEFIAKLVIR